MAYADPQSTHNPTTGQVIPASWGDVVRDDLEYLARNRPHARVYNSANISTTTSVTAALTFDTERFDVGGCHSTSSNTGRLTVPSGEAGKYVITGHAAFAANATGDRQIAIRLNGTTTIAAQKSRAVATGITPLSVSTMYALVAGDYVELTVLQDSGGNLNVELQANYSPEFSWMWMAL